MFLQLSEANCLRTLKHHIRKHNDNPENLNINKQPQNPQIQTVHLIQQLSDLLSHLDYAHQTIILA